MTVLEDGIFKEGIKSNEVMRVGPNQIGVLIRRYSDTDRHRGKTMCRNRERMAICKPRRETLRRNQSAHMLRHKFLWLEPPDLGCSVMVALANWCRYIWAEGCRACLSWLVVKGVLGTWAAIWGIHTTILEVLSLLQAWLERRIWTGVSRGGRFRNSLTPDF